MMPWVISILDLHVHINRIYVVSMLDLPLEVDMVSYIPFSLYYCFCGYQKMEGLEKKVILLSM